MAAAAPMDFNGFLGAIAALGTVNTDGPGFVGAMAYALTEAGRLKSWSNPATAVQLGMLASRKRGAGILTHSILLHSTKRYNTISTSPEAFELAGVGNSHIKSDDYSTVYVNFRRF